MPYARVSVLQSPEDIAKRVEDLYATGAMNVQIAKIGDEYIITYDAKPRVGRPPKETR